MKKLSRRTAMLILIFIVFFCGTARAQNLDTIGITLLRTVTTNVNGSGVRVAQPEAGFDQVTNWEVNPGVVGQPTGLFTYISTSGSTTNFPNSLSSESGHADNVAGNFYGISGGVATNVAYVDNFDASYFYNNIIAATFPSNIGDAVVNQSFTFGNVTNSSQTNGVNPISVSEQQMVDSKYDNYSAQFKMLFVSAVNNQDSVSPPGTSYNCIGVGVSDGSASIGPTLDNGRSKPDITAPGGETSFSTPLVSGAAAVLMQAALRGDGGGDTNSAADIRTIKALLLNGAIKPADWTNNFPSPLDPRYGAGVLNVFNSYEQLAGGKHGYIASTTVSSGGAHPPTGAAGTVGVLSGWDFNTNTSSSIPSAQDGVKHYYFDVTNSTATATATLVWNRQQNQTAINNLNLFLYDSANSNLVAASTSAVDNVEHIFIPKLPQGRYDLQVWMSAGGINPVSNSEAYALAWEFFSMPLDIAPSGANAALTFPIYPAGFVIEATTNLSAPVNWETNFPAPSVMNNQNFLLVNPTNPAQFFRLHRPNF
jgi:hypothetical protein